MQVRIISGQQNTDAHNVTLEVLDQDHTLGNAVRYVLAKDADTDFVGYSIPHPSENKLHLRVQTRPGGPGTEALTVTKRASDTLVGMCDHMLKKLEHGLAEK
eukprot:CAMPEP_0198330966 /NCGR_PEP_ID=MMETSP1450-20131203/17265_1 /TAXON_ID=753684 ORGANISM="Madagascaria erythrocladiodes, Strain CCMP3234" /NCGR_SAMPLE_ID=MMETSP1450 /ASSEMBLY_ACC=CAM_ASM_001115 /LENGTH=101 /DNA_ID=CAMNT_0044035303 /DNA_START=12 /DNA_END=317 /DNA_ORIENTATION=+